MCKTSGQKIGANKEVKDEEEVKEKVEQKKKKALRTAYYKI